MFWKIGILLIVSALSFVVGAYLNQSSYHDPVPRISAIAVYEAGADVPQHLLKWNNRCSVTFGVKSVVMRLGDGYWMVTAVDTPLNGLIIVSSKEGGCIVEGHSITLNIDAGDDGYGLSFE